MGEFDINIVKNPEIFEQNRLAAHSDHVCYKNIKEKILGKSSYRMNLNGLWKFAYAKNMALAIEGFEKADYDCMPDAVGFYSGCSGSVKSNGQSKYDEYGK